MSKGAAENSVGQCSHARARDNGGDGAAGESGGDKIVAVETLAADGKEQVAGGRGARVDGVAGDGDGAGVDDTRTALRAQRSRQWPPLQG